ncbi:MAG: type IV toxin-antitoxin system AbiEi family antitoxin domain-containing protein [Nocardioides sp.]
MDLFAAALISTNGVLLRRDAIRHGIDDMALHRLVAQGRLVRIRHGAYALADVWSASDRRSRHLMLCDAVTRQYAEGVVLSHVSAAIVQGAPDWGLDLAEAHVTHFEGGGRRIARVRHHAGACGVEDLTRVDGTWVTSPTRTVLDVATTCRPEVALCVASHFLHERMTTEGALRRMYAERWHWPQGLGTNLVLHLADPRHESVGEARTAYLLFSQGLPTPVPQYEVRRPDGSLVARVDFAWPEQGVILEFDGRLKYTELLRAGETTADALIREKARSDEIAELTGWRIIRFGWADLAQPERTAARVRRLLRRTAA